MVEEVAAAPAVGPSGAWGGSVRDRVGSRAGVSHRRLSMASSCSIGHSAESPSDSAAEEERDGQKHLTDNKEILQLDSPAFRLKV